MRKFNLKGTVVERMKGIQREPSKTDHDSHEPEDQTTLNPGFTAAQGAIQWAWRTDIGLLRKNNQDSVILGNGLAGVADGMGGHKAGEIASAGLRDGLLREIGDSLPDPQVLERAVKTVNRELWEQQEHDATLTGMGTTLTILWPDQDRMIIGQVGDSRAYLLRDGEMTQVTNDHSMVADMVRKGVLTEEQAACHPMRNYITRAVGTDEDVQTDLTVQDRKKGDRWLICSDGLYSMMKRDRLKQLAEEPDLEEAAEQLLQAALEGGGKDNISLVLLQDDTPGKIAPDQMDGSSPAGEDPETPMAEEVSPQ